MYVAKLPSFVKIQAIVGFLLIFHKISVHGFPHEKNPGYATENTFPSHVRIVSQGQMQRAMGPQEIFRTRNEDGKLIIPYAYGDEYLNRTMIEAALHDWEANTCIEFTLIDPPATNPQFIMIPPTEPPYLNFVGKTMSCGTYLGQDSGLEGPHHIHLSPQVCKYAASVHEIGHSFGLMHEHNRQDRDEHIRILWPNLLDGVEGQFTIEVGDTYGMTYDYASAMHFVATGFSKGPGPVIRALDPLMQSVMGNSDGLTFHDAEMFNTAYDCTGDWKVQCPDSGPCENGGYVRYWSETDECGCWCPPNTSGDNCNSVDMTYKESILADRSPYTAVITQEGPLTTPGYPEPYEDVRYTHVVEAGECEQVVLTFDSYSMHPRSLTDVCNFDSLEIRLTDDITQGDMYCGAEIKPGDSFVSSGSTMIMHFESYYGALGEDRAYSAQVSFQPNENC